MGRPLYTSILLARHASEVAQPMPPEPMYPVVEKWSRWNAFDPDSDEFFEADNAVYEAFLTEEEIVERAQAQHRENARLLAERLLREADNSSTSLPMSDEAELSILSGGTIDASRPAALQMEVDVETGTGLRNGSSPAPLSRDPPRYVQEERTRESRHSRRQPRRTPAIAEWRESTTGELSSSPVDVAVPRISVVSVEAQGGQRTPSPSPDAMNLVSGLQYLSDSPRPLIPVDSPPRPISPIPNTPARVSGVFATPPSSERTAASSSPVHTVTPRLLAWGSRSEHRAPWSPEGSNTREVNHYLGSRVSSAPAPLTY